MSRQVRTPLNGIRPQTRTGSGFGHLQWDGFSQDDRTGLRWGTITQDRRASRPQSIARAESRALILGSMGHGISVTQKAALTPSVHSRICAYMHLLPARLERVQSWII